MVTVVRDNRTWKVLTLPPPSISGEETDWIELVDSTVERASVYSKLGQRSRIGLPAIQESIHMAQAPR
jgi:hypothetical protein